MKKKFIITLAAAMVLAVAGYLVSGAEGADGGGDDLPAIERAANDYLLSGKEGDVERLKRAFHTSARLQSVDDGRYREVAGSTFVAGRKPGQKLDYECRVLSVDCAGSAAVAKVEMDFGTKRYIDYLSLLKIEGRWRIVNKIYHRDERCEE